MQMERMTQFANRLRTGQCETGCAHIHAALPKQLLNLNDK